MKSHLAYALIVLLCVAAAFGQETGKARSPEDLERRVRQLESEVTELKQIVRQLQQGVGATGNGIGAVPHLVEVSERVAPLPPASEPAPVITADDRKNLDFLHDTTINLGLDTYYGYNFNNPIGRMNLLRAYDVLSNEFSLNQASLIFEHAPDVSAGRRWGGRLDLQFGQATDTLQGNPSNEPRPQNLPQYFPGLRHLCRSAGQRPDG